MTTQSGTSRLFSRLVPLAMLLAAANLYADSPISMSLTGAAEVPPVTTAATGKVNISVLPNRSVSGSIDVAGMVPTMAHVHEGAVGKNGPPIITLIKKSDKVFTVPADAKLSEAQYTSYQAGNLYVNVHSEAHPSGEIRAQLPGKPISIAN
jgi:hypothetical protein